MEQQNGLVFSYVFNGGKGLPMTWELIRQWKPEQGAIWLHLDYTHDVARKWLFEESGIDPIICEALVAEETRPRVMTAPNDQMLLILRGVNCNPGADPDDMVSIRMWFETNRIITMRHRRIMAIEDINARIKQNDVPKGVNEFLVMVAKRLVDRMGDVIGDIDDKVDELEDLVVMANSHAIRPQLASLRRQTISLRRYIAPQRDVLARLQNEKISWLSDRDKVYLREIAERTARFVEDIDAARDRAAITQEELSNRLSEQMNRNMYVLSIITGIFLPLGLITGLLGINVGGIPGADDKHAFVTVCITLGIIALLQFIIFKFRKLV